MIPDGNSTHAQMGPLAFLYMAVQTDLSYMQALLFCAACIAAYSIVALLYPRLSPLSLLEVLILLLIGLILYGIYMPVVKPK